MHASLQFARILCGHFSNRNQAQADPSKFAHINIFFLPLPWEVFQGPGFILSKVTITILGAPTAKESTVCGKGDMECTLWITTV